MKIATYETIKLRVPLNKPMRTRYFKLEQAYCILLILKTDAGFEGQGLVRAASLQDMEIIERFIHEIFAPLWAEKEVSNPGEFWRMLWLSKRNHLQSSFGLYALAAIDIAIWDITAKIASKPLHQFLNVSIDFVVPYGNGGWLSDTKQESISDVEWYLNRGCNRFKIRVGSDNDLDRIKGLREAFGAGLIFSADANQFYDFDSALKMSKRLADFNFQWFEEPLFSNSITELAKLAKLSPIPIATGENMNSHWQIQDICELQAAKIIQPDVIYQGGITEFIKSAALVRAAGLTLSAHLFHELSISLAGLCEKHYVEHIDFFPNDFFINDFSIKEGKIFLPKDFGHGASVSEQAIKKYRLQ